MAAAHGGSGPLTIPPPGSGEPPLVAIDANALDRDGSPRDALVDAFRNAALAGRLRVFVPAGVLAEMRAPGAPDGVRAVAGSLGADAVPPVRAALTARRHIDRIRVRAILRGDGRPGKHDADASHLSEAAEAGCDAFLTRDGKILRKRDVLRAALPPGLRIATLEDFMAGSAPAGIAGPVDAGAAGAYLTPARGTRRETDP